MTNKIKTWWHRSLYGYSETTKDDPFQALRHHYPEIAPYSNKINPAWWGRIIAWVIRIRLFNKILTTLGAAILLFITAGTSWFPDLPDKLRPIADSFFSWFPGPSKHDADDNKHNPSN
jgi:hypothetical protein